MMGVQAVEGQGATTSALEEYLKACVNAKAAREALAKAELARDVAAAQFMRSIAGALAAAQDRGSSSTVVNY